MVWRWLLLQLALLLLSAGSHGPQLTSGVKPNIIFLVADDLGFSDVGYRNGDIISPNIDKLASEGVILNSSYVQPTCSPSRAAMLTGRYPFKLGIQDPISMDDEHCLGQSEVLLPQRLKSLKYKTHAIGKWHLGFCNWACVPTRRGFDTFYGIYGGSGDKLTHRSRSGDKSNVGFDFRDNETPVKRGVRNVYSTNLYGDKAVSLVNNHDTSNPMFMWLSFQNVHSPITVPDTYSAKYPQFSAEKAAYYGMVTIMDEYIGKIIDALKTKKMYDNTLIVLTTDNGGKIANGANNWPLRGEKATLYEGGTRGVTLIDGPLLNKRGYINNGLFHAIDWLPTLLHFAEDTAQNDPSLDGVDQFGMLDRGDESSRSSFIYELDNRAAVRDGDYKLIVGNAGNFDGYSDQPTPTSIIPQPSLARKRGAVPQPSLDRKRRAVGNRRQLKREARRNKNKANNKMKKRNNMNGQGRTGTRRGGARGGGAKGGGARGGKGGGATGTGRRNVKLLFNLKDDPSESSDLSTTFPDIVTKLEAILDGQRSSVVQQVGTANNSSNPENFNNFWSPGWC